MLGFIQIQIRSDLKEKYIQEKIFKNKNDIRFYTKKISDKKWIYKHKYDIL